MKTFGVTISGIAIAVIVAGTCFLGLCVVGVVQATRESNAGTAWCTEQGGERINPRGEVICVSDDGRILPAPADRDGIWP